MANIETTVGKDIKNDTQDEIDKIMGEIETLQKELGSVETTADSIVAESNAGEESQPEMVAEMVAETVAEAAAGNPGDSGENDGMEEFRSGTGDAGMEETLGDLKEEPAAGPTLLDEVESPAEEEVSKGEEMPVHVVDNNETDNNVETNESGSLSMTLTGNMTLKLKYEYEGEEVSVSFSDHALMVQLSDGTEFKIPVRRKTALRRVA